VQILAVADQRQHPHRDQRLNHRVNNDLNSFWVTPSVIDNRNAVCETWQSPRLRGASLKKVNKNGKYGDFDEFLLSADE
jgi:hypothetical protein